MNFFRHGQSSQPASSALGDTEDNAQGSDSSQGHFGRILSGIRALYNARASTSDPQSNIQARAQPHVQARETNTTESDVLASTFSRLSVGDGLANINMRDAITSQRLNVDQLFVDARSGGGGIQNQGPPVDIADEIHTELMQVDAEAQNVMEEERPVLDAQQQQQQQQQEQEQQASETPIPNSLPHQGDTQSNSEIDRHQHQHQPIQSAGVHVPGTRTVPESNNLGYIHLQHHAEIKPSTSPQAREHPGEDDNEVKNAEDDFVIDHDTVQSDQDSEEDLLDNDSDSSSTGQNEAPESETLKSTAEDVQAGAVVDSTEVEGGRHGRAPMSTEEDSQEADKKSEVSQDVITEGQVGAITVAGVTAAVSISDAVENPPSTKVNKNGKEASSTSSSYAVGQGRVLNDVKAAERGETDIPPSPTPTEMNMAGEKLDHGRVVAAALRKASDLVSNKDTTDDMNNNAGRAQSNQGTQRRGLRPTDHQREQGKVQNSTTSEASPTSISQGSTPVHDRVRTRGLSFTNPSSSNGVVPIPRAVRSGEGLGGLTRGLGAARRNAASNRGGRGGRGRFHHHHNRNNTPNNRGNTNIPPREREVDALGSVRIAWAEALNAFHALKNNPEERHTCQPTGSARLRLALHRSAERMTACSESFGDGDARRVVMWVDAEAIHGILVTLDEFKTRLCLVLDDIFGSCLPGGRFHLGQLELGMSPMPAFTNSPHSKRHYGGESPPSQSSQSNTPRRHSTLPYAVAHGPPGHGPPSPSSQRTPYNTNAQFRKATLMQMKAQSFMSHAIPAMIPVGGHGRSTQGLSTGGGHAVKRVHFDPALDMVKKAVDISANEGVLSDAVGNTSDGGANEPGTVSAPILVTCGSAIGIMKRFKPNPAPAKRWIGNSGRPSRMVICPSLNPDVGVTATSNQKENKEGNEKDKKGEDNGDEDDISDTGTDQEQEELLRPAGEAGAKFMKALPEEKEEGVSTPSPPSTYPVNENNKNNDKNNDNKEKKKKKGRVESRPIEPDNKGYEMLERLGWQEGQGLGSDASGLQEPLIPQKVRPGRRGLGGR